MKTERARVASKYAEALIEIVIDTPDTANAIANDLKLITQVVDSTPDFTIILNHPSVSSEEKKRLLTALFSGNVQELTIRLLDLLADKRRLELLPYIEQEYRALLRQRKGIVTASVTSAERLPDEAVERIKSRLEKLLSKELDLELKIDGSLIGGMVLKVGDRILDGSLKGKIQALERSLRSL